MYIFNYPVGGDGYPGLLFFQIKKKTPDVFFSLDLLFDSLFQAVIVSDEPTIKVKPVY